MSSSSATALTATRRLKWQYPPPQPTPRILHLPRRPRRRAPKSVHGGKPNSGEAKKDHMGKLEALFDQERAFSRTHLPVVLLECGDGEERERRRERVREGEDDDGGGGVVEEERWRFQAEMLRAECNLLRMEKEIAVKKMERTKVKMERTLKSAVHTLVSGRKKICDGKNISIVLEEEIQHLAEKLEKLQRNLGVKDLEVRKNSGNFDKQAYLLQRQLQKFKRTSDEICVKEIQEMAEASLSIKTSSRVNENSVSSGKCNVEILRRKMEGLSKGMLLEKMKEEYGSMLSTANSSVASSASSSQRIEAANLSSSLVQQFHWEKESREENVCSGRCKAIVRRIVEQVRVETEQWSQMQEILGQVREEMVELQTSRDFWEDRALDSDYQIQSLRSAVHEWRHKAVSAVSKTKELQAQVSMLHGELDRLRNEESTRVMRANSSPFIPRNPQNEMEKRVLICHLKENQLTKEDSRKQRVGLTDGRNKPDTCTNRTTIVPKRSPFRDMGNTSFAARQNPKAIFHLPCHPPSKT
ncbi:uncharacterized protein LOC103955904 isoform X1 [Pyrus x bretschneideri]|uniref:uncharacterized protein LOC103955904 isoform X1 n=1 Tax=Pyrus x bretschneideri TaxID=225117 RepID=UPI00202E6912|nr:uncharacterized protein LOC103955904 isoform X1 [Pyrus x bretschneideri]